MKKNFRTVYAAFNRNDTIAAIEELQSIIKQSPLDAKIIKTAAVILKDHGEFETAFAILENYLSLGGADLGVYEVMALFAMDLGTYGTALKLLNILIEASPDKPNYYVNYCLCLVKTEQVSTAIELLQNILPQFPESSSLWNLLGTTLADEMGDKKAAEPFLHEAYRLDPQDYNVVNNLGNFYSNDQRCYNFYQQAINICPEEPQPHVGLAIRLFLDGQLYRAYPHYEYRLKSNQGLSKVPTYIHKGQIWNGESLEGKSILIMAEQGLGDEAFFSLNFARVCQEAESVYISCDVRLVDIYKRSFPKAQVLEYKDTQNGSTRLRAFPFLENISDIDYAVCAGSLMQYYWRTPWSIAPIIKPVLLPDVTLVKNFSDMVNKPDGRIKVGLSWRSSNLIGERQHVYATLEAFSGLFSIDGVDFYSLQYDLNEEELFYIREKFPKLHVFDKIDLKKDIESTIAIIAAMDIIIGPGIATQMFAVLQNKEVCFLSRGRPWWSFGGQRKSGPFLAPKCTWHFVQSNSWQKEVQERILSLKLNYDS